MKKEKKKIGVLRKIVEGIEREIEYIPDIMKCIWTKLVCREEMIFLRAAVIKKDGHLVNNNWGDDINYYFFNEIFQGKVLLFPYTYLTRMIGMEHFLCIGSIISFYDLKNSTIWGSGLLNDVVYNRTINQPKKICAVRGPKTREWLVNQGIECPEVYGDPALLLPLFYNPSKSKKYRVGVIPHFCDVDAPGVKTLLNNNGVKLISMRGYNTWTDIIDEINSCELIVSSSLHGLIVAEAYGIPAIWAEFGEYVQGWEFKYYDFYASIHKDHVTYTKINENIDISSLVNLAKEWEPGEIDLKPLIDSCPFGSMLQFNNKLNNVAPRA